MPDPDTAVQVTTGEKCGTMGPDAPAAMFQPYGGATSFDEVDRYREANELRGEIDELTWTFQQIVQNTLASDDIATEDKANRIEQSAAELRRRLATTGTEQNTREVGPLRRIARALGLAGEGEKAITKTEGGVAYPADDFADVADPEKPATWKLRLAEGGAGRVTVAQVARAITALQPGGFRGNKVTLGTSKAAVVSRISAAIGKADGEDTAKAALRKRLAAVKEFEWGDSPTGGFGSFKDASGAWRWLAIYSNRYMDREGETFSEHAHREYESHVDRTKQFPELRPWHVPYRMGIADQVAYDDRGFMLASGTWDPGFEDVAARMTGKGLGVSHGYIYRPDDLVDGVYRRYRSFEISPLPPDAAANPLTAFDAEEDGMLPEKKRDWLLQTLGADRVKALEGSLTDLASKATADGIAYKDVVEALVGDPPAANDGPPAAPPTEPPPPEKGEPQAADAKALGAALTEALGPVTEALAGIKAQIDAHDKAIADLKASDDQKLADAWFPRAAVHAKAYSASAADDTVLDGRSAEARALKNQNQSVDDWYLHGSARPA